MLVADKLKIVPSYVKSFFTKGHERSLKAKKNILASFVIRGLSIVCNMLLVPVTINYVDATNFGIWITLSSIVSWFAFFDIGLGHGLRNRFAEALAKDDKDLARTYVSTTYALIVIIVASMLILFFCINPFLDWIQILNTTEDMRYQVSLLVIIVFSFFCIRFVFQIIGTILTADQKPAFAEVFKLLGSILSLLIVYILTITTSGNLLYLGIAISVSPVIVLVLSTFWFFLKDYSSYRPGLSMVKFKYTKYLMSLGAKFFIIQIAGMVVYQSSNIIISQLFGPAEVTPYFSAFRYFSLATIFFGIITAPFWSAFTEANAKNDVLWISKTMSKLVKLWGGMTILIIVMLIASNLFYDIWLGDKVEIPFVLSLYMSIYVIVLTFGSIFVTYINGVGKIRLQMFFSILGAIVFVPLAILLSKYLHMGVSGLIVASIVINLFGPIISPIQYYKIIKNNAKGIWNK